MSVNLSLKDWLLISAFLDERLSLAEVTKVEIRLQKDPRFKQAFTEIQYTRKTLRSLPKKRAPRNFTISPQRIKAPIRRGWFQPALSFVSITAALALVVVFAGSTLLPALGARSAAPLMASAPAAAPLAAMDSTQKSAAESAPGQPVIIQWFPEGSAPSGAPESNIYHGPADGLGGAGGSGLGMGGGGASPSVMAPVAPPASLAPLTVESPTLTTQPNASYDPSTLILGLPQPGTGGETLNRASNSNRTAASPTFTLPISTIWMIGLAALALVSGLFALIFRRR